MVAMVELAGNDLWTIDNELRKLATYADGGAIGEDDIRQLVSHVREANAFHLMDAVVEGRANDAVKLLQQLLADGESPLRLLALLSRQYKLLILAKELQGGGVRQAEFAKRLGVHSFVGQRILQQLSAFTYEQLRDAYRRLLEADLRNLGWDVLTVWECETRDMVALTPKIVAFLEG